MLDVGCWTLRGPFLSLSLSLISFSQKEEKEKRERNREEEEEIKYFHSVPNSMYRIKSHITFVTWAGIYMLLRINCIDILSLLARPKRNNGTQHNKSTLLRMNGARRTTTETEN